MSPPGWSTNPLIRLCFSLGGALMDVGRLAACIRSNIGDITFLEAYEVSGRVLSVTVTSTRTGGDCHCVALSF